MYKKERIDREFRVCPHGYQTNRDTRYSIVEWRNVYRVTLLSVFVFEIRSSWDELLERYGSGVSNVVLRGSFDEAVSLAKRLKCDVAWKEHWADYNARAPKFSEVI